MFVKPTYTGTPSPKRQQPIRYVLEQRYPGNVVNDILEGISRQQLCRLSFFLLFKKKKLFTIIFKKSKIWSIELDLLYFYAMFSTLETIILHSLNFKIYLFFKLFFIYLLFSLSMQSFNNLTFSLLSVGKCSSRTGSNLSNTSMKATVSIQFPSQAI